MGKFVYQRRMGWKKRRIEERCNLCAHLERRVEKKIKIRNFRFNNFSSLFSIFTIIRFGSRETGIVACWWRLNAACTLHCATNWRVTTANNFHLTLWPALCSARSCPTVKSGSFIRPVQLSYDMCVLLSVVLASTCKNEMWLKLIFSMPYS